MPLGDIAGEVLSGILRFLGEIFLQVIVEILIRGPGYLICRVFDRRIDSEGIWVFLAGILFWVFVGFGGHYVYKQATQFLDEDRCLDAGGSYNEETKQCLHG